MSRQRIRNRLVAVATLVVGFIVCFLITPTMQAATVNIGSGLVAHWSFNESSGSVAGNDATQSTALDGTLLGDAAFVGGGMFGNAVSMDGSGDYVDIVHEVIPDQAVEYTYSAWFQSASLSSQHYILETATGGSNYAMSARTTDANIQNVFSYTIGTGGGTETVPTFAIPSPTSDWHLLTVTYQEGVALRAYIDGSFVNQDTALGPNLVSTDGLHIGADRNMGRMWNGLLDDVGIWSRVLNDDEIAHLYNGGAGNEIAADPMVVDITNGLVGYWPMNEASGNTALNMASTGATLDGTLMGDPVRVVGKVGGALQLDGDGDYVDIVNEVIPDGQDSYTAVAWFNPAEGGPLRQMIFETSGSWAMSTELSQNNLRIKYSVETDSGDLTDKIKESNIDPVEGQWYHLALVYDEFNNVTKLYVNGEEQLDYRGSLEGNLASTDGFHIGTYRLANDRWFKGEIDEVAVWDRPLNDTEIAYLWNGGDGIAVVPEPSSPLLAGWSLLALAAFAWRRILG